MNKPSRFVVAFCLWSCLSAAPVECQSDDSADTTAARAAIQRVQNSGNDDSTIPLAGTASKSADCKTAVDFVESPTGLLGEWDASMKHYTISRDGGFAYLQPVKAHLLSDSWWARSSGPDVVRDIDTFVNVLTDVMGAMSPSGDAVVFTRGLSKDFGMEVKARSVKIFEAIESGKSAMDAIRDGTDGLAVFAAQESLKSVGKGQLAAIVGVLKDVEEHAANAREGAEYKSTVQEQLKKLDVMLNKYGSEMALDREKLESMEAIKDTVVAACNSGQPIATLPRFTAAAPESPASSFTQASVTQTPSVPPWWITLLASSSQVAAAAVNAGHANSVPTQPGSCSTDVVGPGPRPTCSKKP